LKQTVGVDFRLCRFYEPHKVKIFTTVLVGGFIRIKILSSNDVIGIGIYIV
jgi:hypothetical protein